MCQPIIPKEAVNEGFAFEKGGGGGVLANLEIKINSRCYFALPYSEQIPKFYLPSIKGNAEVRSWFKILGNEIRSATRDQFGFGQRIGQGDSKVFECHCVRMVRRVNVHRGEGNEIKLGDC